MDGIEQRGDRRPKHSKRPNDRHIGKPRNIGATLLPVDTIFGSVPGIPGTTTEDFDRQIAEAISDAMERILQTETGE